MDNTVINVNIICFLPVIVFFIIECLYDFSDVKKNYKKIMQQHFIFMGCISRLVFSYIMYTYKKDNVINVNPDGLDKKQILERKTAIKSFISLGFGLFFFILCSCIAFSMITGNMKKGILIFFVYAVITLGNLSYVYERARINKIQNIDKNATLPKLSFIDYFTKGLSFDAKTNTINYMDAAKSIIPGLVFGVVFGFIDNAGLISGLEALDEPFGRFSSMISGIKKPSSGGGSTSNDKILDTQKLSSITSGLGNLFSDGLGVTIGAFFGKFASSVFPQEIEQPIWVDMIGISLGCIIGIIIPISIKNLLTQNLWKKGHKLSFIKDVFVALIVITIIISIIVILPKYAYETLNKEVPTP